MNAKTFPTFDELMAPTIRALEDLGGSGTNGEIVEKLISGQGFGEEVQARLHNNGPSTELEYRAAWARSYLKELSFLENTGRGVWALTEKGRAFDPSKISELLAEARRLGRERKKRKPTEDGESDSSDGEGGSWKATLLQILTKKLSPEGFERLTQRLLREAGFKEVKVTGRVGDGGIDGVGILRNGLLSEAVLFQCKRQQGSVGPGVVRDFRGAMQGRSRKGLLVTTSTFTSSAKEEATRDGAPPVELIDGDRFCDLLKEYKLGVQIRMIEDVVIAPDWFDGI